MVCEVSAVDTTFNEFVATFKAAPESSGVTTSIIRRTEFSFISQRHAWELVCDTELGKNRVTFCWANSAVEIAKRQAPGIVKFTGTPA